MVARADQLLHGNRSALVAWVGAALQALAGGSQWSLVGPLNDGQGLRGWVMVAQEGAADNAAFPALAFPAFPGNRPRAAEVLAQTSGAD